MSQIKTENGWRNLGSGEPDPRALRKIQWEQFSGDRKIEGDQDGSLLRKAFEARYPTSE